MDKEVYNVLRSLVILKRKKAEQFEAEETVDVSSRNPK